MRILPAAPLPGGVKVARRPVKRFGVGASPTLAANFQGVMSAADGLVRNEEVAGATPATLTSLRPDAARREVGRPSARQSEGGPSAHRQASAWRAISGRQADISWLHLSRKQDPYSRRWVHYPRLPPLSCSSRAERPADNRKTAERYRAGQPAFAQATAWRAIFPTGWCSQSARRSEKPEVSAQSRLQWPLSVNAKQLAQPAFQVGPLLFAKRTSFMGKLTCRAWEAKSVQVRSRMPYLSA